MTSATLHICNYNEIIHLDLYSKVISKNDSIVFLCKTLSESNGDALMKFFNENIVYFLVDDDKHHLSTISYDDLVELTLNHRKTLTWN